MAGNQQGTTAAKRHGCWYTDTLFGTGLLFAAVVLRSSLADEPPAPPLLRPAIAGGVHVEHSEAGRSPARAAAGRRQASSDAAENTAWHQILVHDRKLQLGLQTAVQQLETGDIANGLDSLQRILNRTDDGFVHRGGSQPPEGAHRVAEQLLGAQPADTLRLYQVLHGSEAQSLLDQARSRTDVPLIEQVARRYFHTAAGFEASDWLATRWMDHGAYDLAAAAWEHMLADPGHQPRVRAAHRLKAAYCLNRCGQPERASAAIRPLAGGQVTIAGRVQSARTWLDSAAGRAAPADFAAVGRVVGNTADRNGGCAGSPPILNSPVWSASLADDRSRHVATRVAAWQSRQQQNGQPQGSAQFPILVGDDLVFRDYSGIRCVAPSSGQLKWTYRCAASLANGVPAEPAADANADSSNLAQLLVGNGVMGMLSSDGRRVFFIDHLESNWNQPEASSPQPDAISERRQTNTLVAVSLPDARGAIAEPLWSIGGPESGRPLAGHFILGPPLPVGDRLFVMTEIGQQLNVVCLRPETGEVVWSQGVCFVFSGIHSDAQRYYLSCAPAFASGVLVCPTQAGVLAGIDPLSGALQWAYSYDHPDQTAELWASPNSARQRYGNRGYPNLPMIQGDCVVYLPEHSQEIHCVDLNRGRLNWKARRHDLEQSAIEFVAALSPTTVLVVGRLNMRGLSLQTGQEQWSAPLRGPPSGRGVRIGSNYLLPLAEGVVAAVEISTGKRTGVTLPHAGVCPGNLLVGGDLVFSQGLTEVAAFSQAAALLTRNDAAPHSAAYDPTRALLAAELELALGQMTPAKLRLQESLEAAPAAASAPRAEDLLRELLFAELHNGGDAPESALDQLHALAKTPPQRARYLYHRAAFERQRGNSPGVQAAARDLVTLDWSVPLVLDNDPSRAISGESWARVLMSRERLYASASGLEIDSHLGDDFRRALETGDVSQLRRLTFVCADWPQAGPARLELARLLVRQGSYQEAELLLLELGAGLIARDSAQAARLLAELYNERGMYHDAGLLLAEIATHYSQVEVAPGCTGEQYLARFPRDQVAWQAYRRLAPLPWTGSRVKISEDRWLNSQLFEIYNSNNVQFLRTPRGASFDLLDKGRGTAGSFTLVDRQTGVDYGDAVKVPARYYYPVPTQNSLVGHLLPLGSAGAAHGVSLLDRRVAWTTTPPGLTNQTELVRGGPAGPGFCTFQSRQHLFALDPRDGRLLWNRHDLEDSTGLIVDHAWGLFGDGQALVLFANDRTHYTVYDTRTGEELRRGRLDVDRRQRRHAIGRRLFYVTGEGDARRLCIWDPLADRSVWEEPAHQILDASMLAGVPPGTKVHQFVSDADELAYVTTAGRLRIVDVGTGDVRLDAALDARLLEHLGFLRVFGDLEHYYVNLQCMPVPGEAPPASSYIISDAAVPAIHIQGQLCAIDRRTAKIVWQRAFGNCSVLQMNEYRIPALISVCRVRSGNQLTLQVEVTSKQTGESAGFHDQLLPDRILQIAYDRDTGRVALLGAKTEIRIDFPLVAPGLAAAPTQPRANRDAGTVGQPLDPAPRRR